MEYPAAVDVTCSGLIVGGATKMVLLPAAGDCLALENFTQMV